MVSHPLLAAPARLQDGVTAHPGTNGYVSSWGQDLSGVQPTPDSA